MNETALKRPVFRGSERGTKKNVPIFYQRGVQEIEDSNGADINRLYHLKSDCYKFSTHE